MSPGGGWERLAREAARVVPRDEVESVWVFPVLREGPREWGTAVLARREGAAGDRRRIYTARYMLQIKGRERGRFDAAVEEVGAGPAEQLPDLLLAVHRRTDDDTPPVPVDVASWFPDEPPPG